MKLYGCKGCGSAAVEACLQIAGMPYTFVDAIRWDPLSYDPELERLNPLNQVPVLLFDDGVVMSESAAILLWIAEQHPQLAPQGVAARREFLRWMAFIPANLYSIFSFRDFPARWVDGADEQTRFRDKTTERLRTYWQILNDSLAPSPFALGPQISALDVYLAMVSRWAPGRPWIRENCPRLMPAIERTEAHPVVAKVWEANFGG